MKVCVCGCGWVTPGGWGRGPVPAEMLEMNTSLPRLPAGGRESWCGGSRFGRLDLFSRVGVTAVALTLEDAGCAVGRPAEDEDGRFHDIGLIVASASGSLKTDRDFFHSLLQSPGLASPALFVYTLAAAFVGEAALRFGLAGVTLSLPESRVSGAAALEIAWEQLAAGDDTALLVGINNLFAAEDPRPAGRFFQGAGFVLLRPLRGLESPAAGKYGVLQPDPAGRWLYAGRRCADLLALFASLERRR